MAQAQTAHPPHRLGFLATLRRDGWWVEPVVTAVSLIIFFGWLGVSVFLDKWHFEAGPYISPVFEPKLFEANNSIFISPALVVLLGPIPFRATCYYYRRAYYRSWFLAPPACAVGDAGRRYYGETVVPFWFNNLHRFAMYGALVFVPILWWGAIRSFYHEGEIGVGLGSVILVVNAYLLMMYTFSCHSLRHWVGGGLNCFSCSKFNRTRKRLWDYVSLWNERHRFWAWTSLVFIVFTDVYIRLVANGHITDPNTWSGF